MSVLWNFKNITSEPIGSYRVPRLLLESPSGTRYEEELGATASLAGDLRIDTKVVSDINPEVRMRDVTVFKVSQKLLAKPGWKLIVDADEGAKIPVN